VQEWLQVSGTCNPLDLESVCPQAASEAFLPCPPKIAPSQLQNPSATSPIHKKDSIEFEIHCCELLGGLRKPISLSNPCIYSLQISSK
jgi:hypothetical protein